MGPVPKILMNLFILTANLGEVTVTQLKELIAGGTQGFELPGTVSTMEDCRRLGAFLKPQRLPVALNVAVDKDRDPSSDDATIRAAGIAYLKSRIDCAAEMGGYVMAGPFALPWGNFPPLFGQELRRDYIAKKAAIARYGMREVADYAEKKGIKLALEPLTHWEMPGLNRLEEAMAFVDTVDHRNFGLTLDPSHEVLDGDGPEVFARQVEKLRQNGKIFFVQVSAPHRGDMRTSWMPWADFLDPIVDSWKEPVSIEIMNAIPPFAGPSGCGLRLTREPFGDPFEVAKANVELTKKQWESALRRAQARKEGR